MNDYSNTKNNILNNENVREYKKNIDGKYEDTIKLFIVDMIELKYSYLLKINKLTSDMIDEMAVDIMCDDIFNEYIDETIMEEIEEYINENQLEEEENEV